MAGKRGTSRPAATRWRVYVKGVFACVVHGDDSDGAREAAIAALEVRQVKAA